MVDRIELEYEGVKETYTKATFETDEQVESGTELVWCSGECGLYGWFRRKIEISVNKASKVRTSRKRAINEQSKDDETQ